MQKAHSWMNELEHQGQGQSLSLMKMFYQNKINKKVPMSYVPGEAFSPAVEDSNTLDEKIALDGRCLSLCVCVF